MKTEKEYTKDWNDLHCKLVAENNTSGRTGVASAAYRNNAMADYCERMILEGKEVYYNSGENIMSDLQYDRFEDRLRVLRPDSKILEKVG